MSFLTSHNNPLVIATLEAGQGFIGMTICPGKHQHNALSGNFQRDLQQDLDLIKSWGAAAVVTLMSDSELSSLKVDGLGADVESRGIAWLQLPVPDQGLPDKAFERQWVYAGLRLRQLLQAGKRVLVHCRSGLGRTGLIVARLMIELGISTDYTLTQVREARPGALNSAAYEKYLQKCSKANNDPWLSRLLGCLLGGAVGDAFGYTVEFDSLKRIQERFGMQGLTAPVYQQGRLVVSDDTQMTLFTLEGILRCTDAQGVIKCSELLQQIRKAYLDWHDTQGDQGPNAPHGWLASRPALRVRRAPGNTCLSALEMGADGSIENRINDSKGCGGVMRTAPIGFLQGIDLFDLGVRAAALTHGHVDGWIPAGILPRIISRLIQGEEKFLAVRNGYSDGSEWGHVYGEQGTTHRYLIARELGRKLRFNPRKAIKLIGKGWVGDEALAIAIYAFLSGRDFTDVVRRASNHDGDSDSTASIAGQLWGAMHGVSDIPHAWARRLDVFDEILELVQQMQNWQRPVQPHAARRLEVSEDIMPCIRMIEMTHELHIMGYQNIRIFPYLSPSGCYWRLEWAPASAIRSSVEPPRVTNERELARYTSGAAWEPFGWQDVCELSAQEMAHQFVCQFPEIARAGKGDDWEYAGWLTRLLGECRKGRLPYMLADWGIDLSTGVPMTQGEPFPRPPAVKAESCGLGPEGLDRPAAHNEPQRMAASAMNTGGVDDEEEEGPEPSQFDFTNLYSRTHGLAALYYKGATYLLQVTQLIWQLLPEPREAAATMLCVNAGLDSEGKLGLHKLLENFLVTADEACADAGNVDDEDWKGEDGGPDWKKIEQTFELMHKAVLKEAFYLSQCIEQVIHPQQVP